MPLGPEPLTLANQPHHWEAEVEETLEVAQQATGRERSDVAVAGPVLLEMREGPVGSYESALAVACVDRTVFYVFAARREPEDTTSSEHECRRAF